MTSTGIVLSIVTSIGFIGMALAALARRRRHPMSQSFAQLTAALGLYKLFEPASDIAGDPSWDVLEDVMATLAAPPALAVFAAYLGVSRRLKVAQRLVFAYFLVVALLHGLHGNTSFPWTLGQGAWAQAMLIGLVPPFIGLSILAVQHWRVSTPQIRARTQMLAVSLAFGIVGVSTDLMSIAGFDVPRLSDVGLIVSVLPLGWVALESDVIERSRGTLIITLIVSILVGVLGQVLVYAWAGSRVGLFALGSAASTLFVLASIRPLLIGYDESRLHTRYLTTMGRLSSQMAHDLRNPLAAILGSIEYVKEECRREALPASALTYLELIEAQARRMTSVVEDYKRLGQVEPRVMRMRIEDVLADSVETFKLVSEDHDFQLLLPETLPAIEGDRELLEAAVDNLLRNAMEATEGGGRIEVSAALRKTWLGPRLRLEVRDDGPGVDPSIAEQAFDDAFTTKVQGSGLGLSYVARVAEAHGGRAFLEASPERGTQAGLEIPVQLPDED